MESGNSSGAAGDQFKGDSYDLMLAEECKTWRQLFSTLKERAEHRREKLAQKMRDNRKRENSQRPTIMKVRRREHRKEGILSKAGASSPTWGRGGGTVESHGGAKIFQLRKEAHVQATREKSGMPTFKKQSGFGQAVAFAATTKLSATQKMYQQQDRKRKAAALVSMGAGKRMAVPQKAMRMQGTKFQHKKPAPAPRTPDKSRRR